jgi:uncharacterized protein YkwD
VLDQVALDHSKTMRNARRIGHDLGQGDAETRVRSTGLSFSAVGENVARAGSAERAHAVLHASPSHRATMLYAPFQQVGIASLKGPNGSRWVTQIFAQARTQAAPLRRR